MPTLYGTNHIFTSRNNEPIINLLSGPNETLTLHGNLVGNITTTTTSTELGHKSITSNQIFLTTPVGTTTDTGTCIDYNEYSDGTARMIFAALYPPLLLEETRAIISVYKRTNQVWALQTTIDVGSITTLSPNTYNICLDKTTGATIGFLGDGVYSSYKRTGEVWSTNNNFSEAINYARIDASMAIGGKAESRVIIFGNGSGTWVTDQVLQDTIVGTGTVTLLDICENTTTAVFVDPRTGVIMVYVYQGTWILTGTIEKYTSDFGITALSLFDNTLAFSTENRLYICTREFNQEPFRIIKTFELTELISVSLYSETGLTVCSTDTIYYLLKNADWNVYNNSSDTEISIMRAGTNGLVVGKPTAAGGAGNVQFYALSVDTPVETITTSTIDTSDQVQIDSIYPILINNTLEVTGNLSVSGVLTASKTVTPCLLLTGTTVQSVVKDIDVLLTTVFGNDSRGFNSNLISFDYTTGQVTNEIDGLYLVNALVEFQSNNTGIRELSLWNSGVKVDYVHTDAQVTSGVTTILTFNNFYRLETLDYLQLYVLQKSTGNLNVVRAVFNVALIGI